MKKPVISFENFTFKYRSQKEPTLHDINLTIHEGEIVLIAGPSGSGKSTIGHAINGLIPFSYKGDMTGSLKIHGKETRDLDIFSIGQMTGTVLQDTDGQFIGLSVGEDIAFSLENDQLEQAEMKDIVARTAKLVDVDTHLHHGLHELSGGQKQRVSLAGVLVGDGDILLFDEPLANLDPATGKQAIELISRICKETGKTVVIIEHRIEDVLHGDVDRLVVVNEGKILADGSPADLLATDVLERASIRKPLYLQACQYAGCDITSEMHPDRLESFNVQACSEELQGWLATLPDEKPEKLSEMLLELKDVTFGYSSEKLTIKGIDLTVHKGEMTSIVGRNGAGKSTLTKLISGLEKPTTGRIFINGEDATEDTIAMRARKVGLVMQNPNHMISKHMIYDEVAFGLVMRGVPEEEIRERVEETLRICGLYPFRNWPISALSFGQKKRVTIASILVLEPELIILDEPTAGQDFRHYTEMMDFLEQLNKRGITILMVTHDMHLMLEYTKRAVVIGDGRILADAPAVDILADPNIVREAHLAKTSLGTLAERAGIWNPQEFTRKFIAYDREVRAAWR
ncbi:ABC transporter ATP-binding protein [Aciduricibacillus chroicocephali]|uniref:ABC transporter ATP-binding protein n=1 Tax=Aciduricibacillus chroicocephali TaxID=3054939 RepID=A0ABY9KUY0_9BACI|nr:ABC transporter ATP-binding protein [Bacillaceae bacterium 44XB]